jgi:O-methyltransferase
MQAVDYEQLLDDIKKQLAERPDDSFAIIGHTPLSYDLLGFFQSIGATDRLLGVYTPMPTSGRASLKSMQELESDSPDVVVIASDESKEELLEQAIPHLRPATKILLAGYGHFVFRDPHFDSIVRETLVPSLANGYPNTLIHLYQCLQNSAKRNLDGIVAEFGMFKGGTTMLLSQFVELLGRSWKVIGFDTFSGFPPRRSALDMYDHPRCHFHDETSVRRYLAGRNVEIVSGDILATADRLRQEAIVLAFVDTDNFSSASAVLDAIQDRVLPGGAIVFDHFTGRNRFRYTLGERLAAKRLLADNRYFNLHDTGVFFRQP